MPTESSKDRDYKPLSSTGSFNEDQELRGVSSLRPSPILNQSAEPYIRQDTAGVHRSGRAEHSEPKSEGGLSSEFGPDISLTADDIDPAGQPPRRRERKQEKDVKLLTGERWLVRNGHTFTYVGLFIFSILVLFPLWPPRGRGLLPCRASGQHRCPARLCNGFDAIASEMPGEAYRASPRSQSTIMPICPGESSPFSP